jgi:hypothetical protein
VNIYTQAEVVMGDCVMRCFITLALQHWDNKIKENKISGAGNMHGIRHRWNI